MRIISEQITLNPGIEIDGQKITMATVRLLSDAELLALTKIEDPRERSERLFTEQIASVGGETDRGKIEAFAQHLTWPDEERLQRAMDELLVEAAEIQGRELIDIADDRNDIILQHWQQLAAAAYAGYLARGRGGLMLDLKAPDEATYVALDSLSATEGEAEPDGLREHLARLRRYDPERQIVFFIVSWEEDLLRCRCLHSESKELLDPPDAYLAETRGQGDASHIN